MSALVSLLATVTARACCATRGRHIWGSWQLATRTTSAREVRDYGHRHCRCCGAAQTQPLRHGGAL